MRAHCAHSEHRACINNYCSCIVDVLKESAHQCVGKRQSRTFKVEWSQNLKDLKSRFIRVYYDWIVACKTRNFPLNVLRLKVKFEYKKAIANSKKSLLMSHQIFRLIVLLLKIKTSF